MALQAMLFKLAKLSVAESTPNAQQIAANANLFALFGNFIIVMPPRRYALFFKRHRLMPVSVFLSVFLSRSAAVYSLTGCLPLAQAFRSRIPSHGSIPSNKPDDAQILRIISSIRSTLRGDTPRAAAM